MIEMRSKDSQLKSCKISHLTILMSLSFTYQILMKQQQTFKIQLKQMRNKKLQVQRIQIHQLIKHPLTKTFNTSTMAPQYSFLKKMELKLKINCNSNLRDRTKQIYKVSKINIKLQTIIKMILVMTLEQLTLREHKKKFQNIIK